MILYRIWMCVCCSKEAFVFLESVKEDEWMRAVGGHLHPGATYSLVRHVRLVGMLLIIYARDGGTPGHNGLASDALFMMLCDSEFLKVFISVSVPVPIK